MMHDMGSFGMGGMWLFWIFILVIAVVLVRWLASSGGSSRQPTADESPEEILKKRYARGELTTQEYERKLDELRS
jgi:putative membrane protein